MDYWLEISGHSILRNIGARYRNLLVSAERLSSGQRINRASDGPADLVISERLRSQIAALNQEIENLSASINKYDYASATVSGLQSQLVELRSLALGAANSGGNDEGSQAAYRQSAEHLIAAYNRVVSETEYNGATLLDGSDGSLASLDELEGIDLSSAESAQAALAGIDDASAALAEVQVDLGATRKNQLESELASLEISRQNLVASESVVRDTDYALEYTRFVRNRLALRAGLALLAHSEISAQAVLSLLRS